MTRPERAYDTVVWMHDLSARADWCRGPLLALTPTPSRVIIVHATGEFPSDVGPVAEEAQTVLSDLVHSLRAVGVPAELRVVSGRPAEVARETALSVQADLLLAGATGVSGLDRVLVGSEAQRIVRAALCPVLVVGSAFHQIRRVTCPVSPEEPDLAAVREAARICLVHQAELEVVAVEPAGSGQEDLPHAVAAARAALATVDDLLPAVPRHTVRAVLGETVLHGILVASRGTDIVVVGTHGRTGIRRLLAGSVAEDLIAEGQRSVLVVHTKSVS